MRQTLSRIVAVFLLMCGGYPAAAAQLSDPRVLPAEGPFAVTGVIDGDTLVLADGREVRLTGIQAPKLPLGRTGFRTWPMADEAKSVLEGLVLGMNVTLHVDEQGEDRYGRRLAHIVRDDGLWLQGAMIENGMARVYTFADNRRLAAALYEREAAARAARRGIWGLDYYAVRPTDPDVLDADLGTFQLVEGRVMETAKVGRRIYLNFGSDYRTDFTATIDRDDWSLFEAVLDPLTLDGRRVRIRGWLKSLNGPMIDLTHPEQIESLN